MVLAVTANLVGVTDPQGVQVVVSGLTVSDTYEVTGTATGSAGVFTWPVRAGTGTATVTQVVLGDTFAPVNLPITYTVATGANGTADSDPFTVPYTGRYLLQALDARTTAAFHWRDNGDPRRLALRTAVMRIPGRTTPVGVWDVPAGEDGELLAVTAGAQTPALKALLMTGGPLLLRTDGTIRDLDPVQFILPTGATRTLTGAGIQTTNDRVWALAFEVIDDPEPDTLLALSTWADFDSAYAGLTWADFNTEWAGLTWNDFDREDWASRA